MKIQKERLMELINGLGEMTYTPGAGVTRFSYSDLDRKARNFIFEKCEAMGLKIYVDPVGNIRVHYTGENDDLASVWIGSHIDSVRNGGRYDGIFGVTSALEVLTVFHENNYKPNRPVELVIFAEEEGSNFGTTMLGSKALVGKCDVEYLKKLKTEDGTTAFELIKNFGLEPEKVKECEITSKDVHAMVELHIEQGIVLDREELKIGVVQAIAGMHTYRVLVKGESNHAGATPMNMRHDPMVAAAKIMLEIEKHTKTVYDSTVVTVGEIDCKPNMPNVIPGTVQFSVDIRDVHEDGIDNVAAFLKAYCAEVEKEMGVEIMIQEVGKSKCIELAPRIVNLVEEMTKESGAPYKCMNSGAVHDAAMLADITEVGMIFVPSVNGKSHNAEEYTDADDLAAGANILLQVVKQLTA